MSDREKKNELRHNPYVGTFLYMNSLDEESTNILNEYMQSSSFSSIFQDVMSTEYLHNPVVGFFRHSQSTQTPPVQEENTRPQTRDVACQVNMYEEEFVMIHIDENT